jgi:hydrophobe/amphiphile efflux-1 (HAE1) family protein
MFRFFIHRPIFSSVISIVIVVAGIAALINLPVEQYPDVVPPQVVVTALYPGASAEVLAESIAAPLEQEINGVDDMIYIESTSSDAGMLMITVTFAMGTNPDQAAINVNNRVQAALPRLPQVVRELGVRVESRSTNILMVPVLRSSTQDPIELSNYALLNILDELARIPGVGNASLFVPQDYSMRIWLRPDKLAEFDLTPFDVAMAIREQSEQFPAGRIGAEPAVAGQPFTYAVATRGQLATAREFEAIILRSLEDGSALRLGDVARAELGAENYAFSATYNGEPTVPMGVFLQPGANALDTARAVRAAFEEMSRRFPDGMDYAIPYDTTEFVAVSIREVLITLLVATVLVVLVTFLFLQHLRATLIPVAAIPVSLIGTFAGMQAFGFSVNLLTLFGLVLAIGIVVDNAIIVMENVERLMHEKGLKARDAAVQTMGQVTGAVIASTLVLVAVFIPVAFFGGLTGELYRQFAVTIAVSVVISGVVAVTLTPAMCALLLDREPKEVAAPFRVFNRGFDRIRDAFVFSVRTILRHRVIGLTLFAVSIAGALLILNRMPSGLVPQEDQGVAIVVYQLPRASALNRTESMRDDLSRRVVALDEVSDFAAFAGFDLFAMSLRTDSGAGFLNLADWRDRTGPGQDAASIANRVTGLGMEMPEGFVIAFVPPPIQGISLTGGLEGYLQVRGGVTTEEIDAIARRFVELAGARPELINVRTTLDAAVPRYFAEVNREKAKAMNVSIPQVFDAMRSTFGSLYVNDFTHAGRLWQVNLQSEAEFRMQPEDINKVFVRSNLGEMIPLSSLVTLERVRGADILNRFNLYPAARILAEPAPGLTSGQAKAAMESVALQLNSEFATVLGWTGEAYQLEVAAGAGGIAFGLGLLMVFLILAAQYERLTLPLAVASAVPFGVLGAAAACFLRGIPNDIYFQVGLLVLIGLAAKNAILIVEFAAQNSKAGLSSFDAAVASARQRFRPIMMTALTFIIGSLPLYFASGAGAASRQEIGTVVVGGMIVATTIALPFVALFYQLLCNLADRWHKPGSRP